MASSSLANQPPNGHRHNFEDVRPQMAKASINKKDDETARREFGQVLARCVELSGMTDKEAADELGTDRAQFSRWMTGKENPQVWRFHQHDLLGPALIAAQAEVTPGATVRTVIELTRKVG
jgi:Ni/Co efflux regulator RcnB